MQIASLINRKSGLPQPAYKELVNTARRDVLAVLSEYCETAAAQRPFCAAVDPTTRLPTGAEFHTAVWHMLDEDFFSLDIGKAAVRALAASTCYPPIVRASQPGPCVGVAPHL